MIGEICKAGYYKLDKLKNMCLILSTSLKLTLVKCYILSKKDYCNFLFCHLPMYQLKCLQKLENSSVRFIYNVRRSASITGYLKKAHILPVQYQIQYKLWLVVHKVLHGLAPSYTSILLHPGAVNWANLRFSVDNTGPVHFGWMELKNKSYLLEFNLG